ncbi:hypothetical protein GCM10007422_01800 [Pedobacter zeae]|uniref:Uncharacterized protein n=1 Tax=Pedobacter zeae TaxID=1737356 RepID=A0A7W6KD28_9SPHI|nr:hypothetical protein [Pedobacter zeae]GGG92397.1 hypothetical protein GCM10007422_01800 [Pedobacter zeae]
MEDVRWEMENVRGEVENGKCEMEEVREKDGGRYGTGINALGFQVDVGVRQIETV